MEGREQREQAEQDRERLARALPRLTAERGHPEQGDVRVQRDREGERAWARGVGVRELQGDEREDSARLPGQRPSRSGYSASGRASRPAPFAHPDERVSDRTPR